MTLPLVTTDERARLLAHGAALAAGQTEIGAFSVTAPAGEGFYFWSAPGADVPERTWGAGFTAKRGTLVKGIRLTNNPLHIEGKVNGVQIVLVAAYLKKA